MWPEQIRTGKRQTSWKLAYYHAVQITIKCVKSVVFQNLLFEIILAVLHD